MEIGSWPRGLRWMLVCAGMASATAWAQGADALPSTSVAYRDCMQRAAGVNADMHACIATETKLQDTRLNSTYAQLRAAQSPPRRAALTSSQRDWMRFRDSNCGFRNDPEGGSAARLGAGLCVLRMTAERADELQSLQGPR